MIEKHLTVLQYNKFKRPVQKDVDDLTHSNTLLHKMTGTFVTAL